MTKPEVDDEFKDEPDLYDRLQGNINPFDFTKIKINAQGSYDTLPDGIVPAADGS